MGNIFFSGLDRRIYNSVTKGLTKCPSSGIRMTGAVLLVFYVVSG